MIKVSTFKTVRARLLALMAFIVIPIATLSIILASANYHSVVRAIESAQMRTASDFAVRARIWFRGSLRTLVATVSSVEAADARNTSCDGIIREVLDRIDGFRALRITLPNGMKCHAAHMSNLTSDVLDAVAIEQKTKPFNLPWTGTNPASTRYDAVRIKDTLHLVVYAQGDNASGQGWEATLLADPLLLDQAFELGTMEDTSIVALMNRGSQIIVARGVDETDVSWLPSVETIKSTVTRWNDVSRSKEKYGYASQLMAEPDLYVLARFDNAATRAAWLQFMVLCITPLMILGLLFATYARVIQNNVVLWIAGIEQAAKSRLEEPGTSRLAPVDASMPHDIRGVAEAFNRMVDDANQREAVLTQAVATNQFLMRELHHRVKNSLQVIQSYLALSRRQLSGSKSMELAETEAKVQVLSTAYRQALTDGGMKAVLVKSFAEEIVGNLSLSMRRADQWISVNINTDAALVVDRIIPLGLLIVEAIIAALKADSATKVTLSLISIDDGKIELVVTTNGKVELNKPSLKIVTGLAAQLEAQILPVDAHMVLKLDFSA